MRGIADVTNIGEIVDAPGLAYATRARDIRLDNADEPILYELRRVLRGEVAFPGRKPDG